MGNSTNFFNEVVGSEPTIITELVNNHATEPKSSTNKSKDPVIQLQLPEEIVQDESELVERSEVAQKTEKKTERTVGDFGTVQKQGRKGAGGSVFWNEMQFGKQL